MGVPLDHVRVHTGPDADAATASVRAHAFTVGDQITFAAGRFDPNSSSGRNTLAHELAHVVHDGGVPVVHRVGAADPPFGAMPAERELLERMKERERQAEARTTRWRGLVAGQAPRDLKGQAADLKTDVERSELLVVAARSSVLAKIAQWLPPGFPDDWATAQTLVELMRAALAPDEKGAAPEDVPFDVQDYVRTGLTTFYTALHAWEMTRYNNAVATARNNYLLWKMTQLPVAGTRLGDRRPPENTQPPPSPTMEVRRRAGKVREAVAPEVWRTVLAEFGQSTSLVDRWAIEMLREDSPERQALQQAVGLHERQAALLRDRPYARKIRAVFYPRDELTKPAATSGDTTETSAPAAPEPVGYPWFFYLYRKPGDPDWYLEDLTAPDKRVNVHDQSAGEGFAVFAGGQLGWPKQVNPPESLWEQLNTKLRFPEGELHITLPDETPYTLVTTAPTSLSEYLGYAAMIVGGAALILFTAGAGTPAAIAVVASAGLGIAGTVTQLSELEEQGMATGADRARAALSIATDLASIFTMGLGRVAAGAARAGQTAGTAAKLAGRLYLPVARASVALEVTQLFVMTDQFVDQYRAIANQPGLTDDQRRAAQARIVMFGLATGALSTWSIRSTVRDIAAHGTISADDLVPSSGVRGPRPQLDPPPAGTAAPRASDFRLGRATLVEGAQLVDTLAPGTVHVELRRNRWGLVSEIAVVHGPPPRNGAKAFAADILHHQQVAKIALDYSGLIGEIRELLEKLGAALSGRLRGPLERELDLAKLENRIQDRLRRLADPKGISAAERRAYARDVQSFRNQIEGQRQAIARGDPRTGRIAQQGTPTGYPAAPAGYTYHYDTVRGRWDVVPDVAGGPRLRVEVNAQTGQPTGRFSNLDQLETLRVTGLPITDPTIRSRLAAVGYDIGPDQSIRVAPGVPESQAALMVPLRVAGGKVEVTPHVRLDTTSLGTASYYASYRGKTLDTETMVALHGQARPEWHTPFVPVTAALGRAGAEGLWRRASLYRLVDYIRYHILGPGTGLEKMRIFLAPEAANQFANNHIEGFMRRLRDSGQANVSFRVHYQSFSGPELREFIDAMLTSGDQKLIRLLARDGGRFERLLKFARYDIKVVRKNGAEELYQASVEIGAPGPARTGTVTGTAPTRVTQF